MPILTQPPPTLTLPTSPNLYLLTVEQYHRMIAAGIFTGNDRVELLEGYLVKKMTQNPPHAVACLLLCDAIGALLPEEWRIRPQLPITLTHSEPEPDLAVVRGPARRYQDHHPGPTEIALVVEVADSSLANDRETKGPIYAQARLPIYWIVNLIEGQVEVYSQPKAGKSPAYRQRQDYRADAKLPLIIAGQEVATLTVRDLLPDAIA